VINLLREYDRLQKKADQYPVVRLSVGGFEHEDSRIGRVNVPERADQYDLHGTAVEF
jgi:hypothetical protein